MLAALLERLEHSKVAVGAAQYRSVVAHLAAELTDAQSDPALAMLLDNFPAAAELYENQHYGQAGLCRSPLESATRAELEAQRALARARRPAGTPARHDKA